MARKKRDKSFQKKETGDFHKKKKGPTVVVVWLEPYGRDRTGMVERPEKKKTKKEEEKEERKERNRKEKEEKERKREEEKRRRNLFSYIYMEFP